MRSLLFGAVIKGGRCRCFGGEGGKTRKPSVRVAVNVLLVLLEINRQLMS